MTMALQTDRSHPSRNTGHYLQRFEHNLCHEFWQSTLEFHSFFRLCSFAKVPVHGIVLPTNNYPLCKAQPGTPRLCPFSPRCDSSSQLRFQTSYPRSITVRFQSARSAPRWIYRFISSHRWMQLLARPCSVWSVRRLWWIRPCPGK